MIKKCTKCGFSTEDPQYTPEVVVLEKVDGILQKVIKNVCPVCFNNLLKKFCGYMIP
jgi:hypothetical protein